MALNTTAVTERSGAAKALRRGVTMFSKLRTELSQSTGNLDPLMNGRQACAPRLHEDVAGLRGKRRKQLPAMSPEFIASCD